MMIQTVYGPLSVPDWPDDLIVRTLRNQGEWGFCEAELLAPLVRPEDRIWDVGAFLGTFGLGLIGRMAASPAKLVAVEPNEALHAHLTANLATGVDCPAAVVTDAVAGAHGKLSLRSGATGPNAGANAYEHVSAPAAEGVDAKTLWQLRAEHGDYDLLKLDVEGMENEILRGDSEFIRQKRPVIWTECNEDVSSIAVLETLVWAGYTPLYLAFPAFRSAPSDDRSPPPYPMAYEAALLAAPPDRLDLVTGRVAGEEIIAEPVMTSYDLRKALWRTPRWAMAEWTGLSRPELVALLGRQYRGEELGRFLNDPAQTAE